MTLLTLWKDVTIKAKAFKLGMVPSETAEASYIITGGTQPADGDTYDENDPFQPEVEEEIEEEPLDGEVAAAKDPYLENCLSYQKDVYVSSSEHENSSVNITDGNENTLWSSKWENISNEERFNQWCYIDLGEPALFNEARIKWNKGNNHYKIQVSDDAENWKDVYISTKKTSDGETDICRFDKVTARYVKMQGIKAGQGWGYSLFEMMVYLSDEEQPLGQNVGAGMAVTSPDIIGGNDITYINDGDTGTSWKAGSEDPQSVELNLFRTYEVNKVVLNIEDGYTGEVDIKVSEDGENWTNVTDGNTRAARYGAYKKDGVYKFEVQPAKYVKAEFSTGENLAIREFEVYTTGSADVAEVITEYYERKEAGASTRNEDAVKIIDGDKNGETRWQAEEEDKNAWCYIDLSEPKYVNFVSVYWETSCADLYDIYLTNELDSDGNPVLGEPAYKDEIGKPALVGTVLSNPATARYVVLKQTKPSSSANQYGCSLYEFYAGYRNPVPVESITAWPLKTTTLAAGQTLDAICIVSPSNADNTSVIWSSDNTKVATVNSKGVVKGKKAGTAVITVKSAENPDKKADIYINVTGPLDAPRPKAEKTGDNEITVRWTGSENAIGYNIYRSKSQNNGYKKLNDEMLYKPYYVDRGLTKGTYYYKVEFIANEEGTVYRNSPQSTQSTGVKIEVQDDVTLILEKNQYEVEAGKSVTINASVTPACTKIAWKSSNTDIAVVRGGVVTGIKEGAAIITVEAGNRTDICIITVIPAKAEDTATPEPADTSTPEPEDTTTPGPERTKTPGPAATAAPSQTPAGTGTKEPEPSGTGKPAQQYPWIYPSQTPEPGGVQIPVNTVTPAPGDTFVPLQTPVPVQEPDSTLLPVTEKTPEPADTSAPEPGQPDVEDGMVNITKIGVSVANYPYGTKTARLVKKGKLVLNVTFMGDGVTSQKAEWSSSNNKIATVNSKGVVKAKNKTGTAVITAKSVIDSTKKASIKVKVVAKRTANKVLKLKKTKIQLDKKGQKAQIKIKKYTKKTTDLVYYKVISGKKYIKVNKYGKITCSKRPAKKNTKAKVQVRCGNRKKLLTVKIIKKE